jgi:hypothetical protein
MRALVAARTRNPVPVELAQTIAHGFREWREQHREKLKEFAFFTSGDGGCAIVEVANETELFQIMATWPLTPYSHVKTYTLVDGDEALDFWVNMIDSRFGGEQG